VERYLHLGVQWLDIQHGLGEIAYSKWFEIM